MALAEWETYALSSRLKSERRKKRLQKKEQDKKLMHLYHEFKRLQREQQNLGFADLIPPVQKGWKRFFVLRQDVVVSKDGKFFQELLEKINTTTFSHRKDFKKKRKKNGKRVDVDRIQKPKEFMECEFRKLALTEREKLFFKEEWRFCYRNRLYKVYVFTEPWRFVLRVKPNMVTQVRIIDPLLKQRADEIDNYLERNSLYGRVFKVMGNHHRYSWPVGEKVKYKNLLRKDPLDEIEIDFSNTTN
jgi:hypothetical protein